jgi:arsenate reductase-like glutaredoxin family protein
MRVFALKTCDTCRTALAQLRAAGHAPQVIDIRSHGIGPADLAAMIAQFGDKAINRASTTWRGLTEAERARDPATLLATYPTLLKRPVIDRDGVWTMGWTPMVQAQVL